MSKLSQELSLLFYLNERVDTKRLIKIDEMANYLETTPRQTRRYIEDILKNADIPIETKTGRYGGYRLTENLAKGFFLPENVTLATFISTKQNKHMEEVLYRISKNISTDYIDGDNKIKDETMVKLETILKAIIESKKIVFDYTKTNTQYTVEPYKINFTNHTYYLYCVANNLIKNFDINYMENIVISNNFQKHIGIENMIKKEQEYYGIGNGREVILKVKCFNNETLEKFDKYFENKGITDKNNLTFTVKTRDMHQLFYPLFRIGTKDYEILDEDIKREYINYLYGQIKSLKRRNKMKKEIQDAINQERYNALNINCLNLSDDELYIRDKGKKSIGFNVNNYMFNEFTLKFICDKFKLSNPTKFKEKFNEAISGDGNELCKITALQSSSLCALLCFYNISEINPFILNDITYTNSFFEVKNKVERNPSNMDVVLTGKNSLNEDCILFIECKFSEFIGAGKYNLGKTYRNIKKYQSIFNSFKYDNQKVFQYGLKQLVTHYIGITNFIKGMYDKSYKSYIIKQYPENDARINLYGKEFKQISFMELVYDFPNSNDYKEYKNETSGVFDALETEKNKSNINLTLLRTKTYQEIFKNDNKKILDLNVRKFYKLL